MKQILIIEDDPRIAGLERDYLEAAGLQASVARTAPPDCARRWMVGLT